MQINIKQLILEGYSYDEITEAVHANHPNLNKRLLKDPATSYKEGKEIEKNRKELRDDIKHSRSMRDDLRKLDTMGKETAKDANYWDNDARGKSQTAGDSALLSEELRPLNFSKTDKILRNVPRIISSAKE